MTLFLRDKNNITILDMELWIKDNYIELSSTVIIDEYSKLLLNTPEEKREDFIKYFDFLSELRGWLWESYFMGKQNTKDKFDDVLSEVRKILDNIAVETGLHRIED